MTGCRTNSGPNANPFSPVRIKDRGRDSSHTIRHEKPHHSDGECCVR